MRKLIVCNIMSLGGYYTGPDNDVMILPMDGAFDAYNAERLRAADTLLLGRTTFNGFGGFWPSVADDESATPINRESRLNNTIDKVVVADKLTSDQTEPWPDTRIISRADAHKQLADLKRRSGKDILVFGSHTLWNDLLADDLVDELHLMICNVIAGAGKPVFNGQPGVSLRLIDTRTWDVSGNAPVCYKVRCQTA